MKLVLAALPLVLFSLLAAVWSGWSRAGFELPLSAAAGQHGNLMVNCFLASLIMLERAVIFRQWWVRLLPLLNAAALVLFIAALPRAAGYLLLAGSVGFAALCAWLLQRHRELHYFVFLVGATALVTANVVVLQTGSYPAAAGWWFAFLLLTIVAERLELSKFLPRTDLQRWLLLICLGFIPAALLLPAPAGTALFSGALVAIGAWLLRFDMARRSVRLPGAHRYSALLLLTGFCWLPLSALFLVLQARLPFGYDAALHSFFIGFVFAMIFSHAPVILPAVLKKRLQIYHPVLYVWFLVLQLSLLVRIGADVTGSTHARQWASVVNGIVITGFIATVGIRTGQQLGSGKA
ncbi:hypothetical protein [Flaviaesturariibacter amylovorans]|uniref:NnrS family protein n=1 Tax=Flaviaesturariibacter amylovorans TaxID=1084520 RepID=A0ABP8H5N6_9BACT